MSVVELTAPVAEVTVLEDRAHVVRRGVVAVPAGQSRLVVEGVAPVLVDKSLLAQVDGGTLLDARCRRRLAPWRTGEGDGASAASRETVALAARLDALAAEQAQAQAAVAVLAVELADVAALRALALRELAAEAAAGRTVEGAAVELARLDAREQALTDEHVRRRLAAARAARDAAALQQHAGAVARDVGVAAATLELDVVADRAGDVTVTVEYVVPGACWRPYHAATLRGGEVIVETDACVWQRTGEDWRDAALTFSTERPSLGASPPPLASDELRVQRRSDAVVVEVREQELETTGLGGGGPQLATSVPGVEDGGVAQVLRALAPATVPSDGRPWRVPLGAHAAPAEVTLVAMPERSPCAFTRSRQVNGGRPLLAGPVDLVRDHGQVGRTSVLYVAGGERFELGWGPDPELRLHREEERLREEPGLLQSAKVTRVQVVVRLSNLGATPRTVEVIERVPVSELDKVEIVVTPPEGWSPPTLATERAAGVELVTARSVDGDGLVRWQVTLPPRGRRMVALEYRVRADGGVVGL